MRRRRRACRSARRSLSPMRRRLLDLDERAARLREGVHDLGECLGGTERPGFPLALRAARPETDRVRPRQGLLRRALRGAGHDPPALEHGRHTIVHAIRPKEQPRQPVEPGVAEAAVGNRLQPGRLLSTDRRHDGVLGRAIGVRCRLGQRAEKRGEHDVIVRARQPSGTAATRHGSHQTWQPRGASTCASTHERGVHIPLSAGTTLVPLKQHHRGTRRNRAGSPVGGSGLIGG